MGDVAVEFTCKCGKQKSWITEGETLKNPCPECGRKYYGEYDRKNLTIKPVEIKNEGNR